MEKNTLTASCRMMILGGSAGALQVVIAILEQLPAAPEFPIVIVLHRGNPGDSVLADLLSFKTTVPIREVEDKEKIEKGVIYLAPADYHLLIESEKEFSLDYSEKINFSRPSIDVTFECAAAVFGEGVTGILLSGANHDGSKGLVAIKKSGGITVVQHPDSARMPVMPQSAIDTADPHYVLQNTELVAFVRSLATKSNF